MGEEEDVNSRLTTIKLLLLFVMILLTVIAGLLPVKVLKYLRHSAAHAASSKQHKHVSLILCLLTCFSGGVFLATCFLHLLPELLETWRDFNDDHYNGEMSYPIGELLSCIGFFLLFFVEELVIIVIPSFAHHSGHGHGHSHGHGHGHSHSLEHLAHTNTNGNKIATDSDPLVPASSENGCCMTTNFVVQETRYNDNQQQQQNLLVRSVTEDPIMETSSTVSDAAGHCQTHCPLTVHSVHRRRPSGEGVECTAPTPEIFTAIALAEPERCETNCEKVDEDPPILMKSSPHAHSHGVRSITFVLALSFHSVIEGIALGVVDQESQAYTLFFSLLVHKLIVAFSVGLQLARTHAHALRWVVASVLVLAIMSPLGGVIGIIVQNATEGYAKEMTIIVMQGLAVGTFIYVTFFEVLLHERDNEHPNLLKLLFIMIGFALIGFIRLLEGEGHSHGHGHAHGHSHGINGTYLYDDVHIH